GERAVIDEEPMALARHALAEETNERARPPLEHAMIVAAPGISRHAAAEAAIAPRRRTASVRRREKHDRARPGQGERRSRRAHDGRFIEPGKTGKATRAHALQRYLPRLAILFSRGDRNVEESLPPRESDELRLQVGHRSSTMAIARSGPPLPPAIF